jgi:hypothetical protein
MNCWSIWKNFADVIILSSFCQRFCFLLILAWPLSFIIIWSCHFFLFIWVCSHLSLFLSYREYIPSIILTPLGIVYNKPHPFLLLHLQDKNTRKVKILFLQQVRHDIIFRHLNSWLHEDRKSNNRSYRPGPYAICSQQNLCPTWVPGRPQY